jgi:hypothetical protein
MGQKRNFSGRNSAHQVSASDGTQSSKVSSPGRYNKATLKGNRWGVKELSTNPKLEVNNHSVQILNEGEVLICLYCGKELPKNTYHKKMKNQVCNNTCRKLLTKKNNEEAKKVSDLFKYADKKHNRKCVVCNKSCFPNYFFCHKHLPKYIGSSLLYD